MNIKFEILVKKIISKDNYDLLEKINHQISLNPLTQTYFNESRYCAETVKYLILFYLSKLSFSLRSSSKRIATTYP